MLKAHSNYVPNNKRVQMKLLKFIVKITEKDF